jgi:hypothetical protein
VTTQIFLASTAFGQPGGSELPLWERHFRRLWSLGDDQLHLVVESIQVNPAQGLCQILGDARINV